MEGLRRFVGVACASENETTYEERHQCTHLSMNSARQTWIDMDRHDEKGYTTWTNKDVASTQRA
jgi:hypothetical protein